MMSEGFHVFFFPQKPTDKTDKTQTTGLHRKFAKGAAMSIGTKLVTRAVTGDDLWDYGHGGAVIRCPRCGGDYLHQGRVFDRREVPRTRSTSRSSSSTCAIVKGS
jgi:hypothetical protein